MNVGIIGAGVVGLATATVLKKKHTIYVYDKFKDEYKLSMPELVFNSEIAFICVPTPMKQSGEMDLSPITDSLDNLLEVHKRINKDPSSLIAVIRSTSVPGTADYLSTKYPFKFASNPEFLTEKNALSDMENTSRIVIGATDNQTSSKIRELYISLFPNAQYFLSDNKTAEMSKYSANVFLASQIVLANEINGICSSLGIDYNKIKEVLLSDKRIGRNLDVPGHDGNHGFGGKCFPKDLAALIHLSETKGYDPLLLKQVWDLNQRVRENRDWLNITGATTSNGYSSKEDPKEN
jgi:UDPglucose 6-dehydrogenase